MAPYKAPISYKTSHLSVSPWIGQASVETMIEGLGTSLVSRRTAITILSYEPSVTWRPEKKIRGNDCMETLEFIKSEVNLLTK